MLNIGWAVLILLALSCYTAKLTAFLTLAKVSEYYDSMEAAVEGNARICAYLGEKYRGLRGLT